MERRKACLDGDVKESVSLASSVDIRFLDLLRFIYTHMSAAIL